MRKMMTKTTLAACLAGALLTGALPAQAVMPSDVSAALELAQNDADAWRAIGAAKPGLYQGGGRVYSYVSPSREADETLEHLKARAEAEALFQLTQAYADRHYAGDSITAQITRGYLTTHNRLRFNGRVLESDCGDKTCRVVFSAPASALELAPAASQRLALQQEARDAFVKDPAGHPDILKALGLPEAALLGEVRALKQAYANVFPALAPTKSGVKRMEAFLEKREAVLQNLARAPEARTGLAVVQAVDDPKAFAAFLQSSGVAPLNWSASRPVLSQVAAAQGFVVIDERTEGRKPAVMSIVKAKFAQGADLPLVTELLEGAAEAAPRNAEVWEYLAAAYYAAERIDQARVCARVWFILSDRPAEPLKYLLTKFETGEQARRLAAIL